MPAVDVGDAECTLGYIYRTLGGIWCTLGELARDLDDQFDLDR